MMVILNLEQISKQFFLQVSKFIKNNEYYHVKTKEIN